MRRSRIINLLALVSLVLFLGVLWAWFTSNCQIRRAPGGILFTYGSRTVLRAMAPDRRGMPVSAGDLNVARGYAQEFGQANIRFLGFEFLHEREGFDVILPYWFLLLTTAVLPAWWLISRRRARAGPHPACAACGYDLRATPQRCPECGTATTAASARTPDVAGSETAE